MEPKTIGLIAGGAVVLVAMAKKASGATADAQTIEGDGGGGGITIQALARSVARAEGYYAPGSKASNSNNPGNIYSNGGTVYVSYESEDEGFTALEGLLRGAYNRRGVYARVETWRDLAWMYVNGTLPGAGISRPGSGDNPDRWLAIVASDQGVELNPDAPWRNDVRDNELV